MHTTEIYFEKLQKTFKTGYRVKYVGFSDYILCHWSCYI